MQLSEVIIFILPGGLTFLSKEVVKFRWPKWASVCRRPGEAGLGRLMIADEAAVEDEITEDKMVSGCRGVESVVKIKSSGVVTEKE
jgi:hypothetical protein